MRVHWSQELVSDPRALTLPASAEFEHTALHIDESTSEPYETSFERDPAANRLRSIEVTTSYVVRDSGTGSLVRA